MELKEDQELNQESQEEIPEMTAAEEYLTPDTQGEERDSFIHVELDDLPKQNGNSQQDTASSDNKTFENIFHVIGHNGRFQILLLVIFVLTNINVEMQNVNTVFTLTTPKHRCKLPGLEQDSYNDMAENQAQLVDLYIPKVKDGGYRKCHIMTGVNVTRDITEDSMPEKGTNLTRCTDWVYDKTVMKRNLVSELDLVCDRKVIRSHVNMVLFGGKMAAAFLQGYLSDLFGRRPSLILSCIGMLATAVGSAFVFDPISLLVARFMAGFFATFLYLSIYVLGIEFLTIQQRSLLSIFTRIIFGLCDLYMALMAYVLRDWQYMLLSIAWPAVLAVALCWFMPESPRWLISKNKVEQAEREVQRIAKMNGRSVPHGITQHLKKPDEKRKLTVLQLFAERRLIVRWTILYINWIVICMSTYGLVFYISNMSGNIFMNFAIGGLLDTTVAVCNSFIVNKLSRKYFYFGCSVFSACACILTFVPIVLDAPSWCVVALSLIAKAAMLAAAPLLYTYSAELFPTTHRGIGVGSCSMMSRIGGLLSAYIADLGLYFTGNLASVLPQIVLGTCTILGTLLVLFLPETRGRNLPETVEDIREKPRGNETTTLASNKQTAVA
ncbi:organic cation transporter protein [Elysia marginata]|uniref:Organic cation transporter protein n=1 Tax=Elysia marginata TaxID=1093978 RepID=A0AAV4HJF1_9GAST|nr:organic cation transporter protein [Elysia marginata]